MINLRISSVRPRIFNSFNPSFSKYVDYGTKDKDLIYVPIIFEEEDSFVPSSTNNSNNPSSSDGINPDKTEKKPSVVGKIATAGSLVLGVGAIADGVSETLDKITSAGDKVFTVSQNCVNTFNRAKDTFFTKHSKDNNSDINNENVLSNEEQYIASPSHFSGNTNVTGEMVDANGFNHGFGTDEHLEDGDYEAHQEDCDDAVSDSDGLAEYCE